MKGIILLKRFKPRIFHVYMHLPDLFIIVQIKLFIQRRKQFFKDLPANNEYRKKDYAS